MAAVAGSIVPGFADPVLQAQQVFRRVLEAMSRPGRPVRLDPLPPQPPGISAEATAVCLALADFETPVWLDAAAAAAREHLAFHCGCPHADTPARAVFAVIADSLRMPPLDAFARGSDERPEHGATLILAVGALSTDTGPVLRGPGIADRTRLAVHGVGDDFWDQVRANHALFPRGVDLLLTCPGQVAALPRSVRLED
jgi:alpha-D-ribose 1-methylphosphonate 5-triphosphate synthase subunit PhnH